MKKYKIVKVDYDINYSKAEKVMNEMSEKGWEVVCISTETLSSMKLVITFCREN